jgi:hypothetical protein
VGVKEYEVKRMELKELLDQKLISNTK